MVIDFGSVNLTLTAPVNSKIPCVTTYGFSSTAGVCTVSSVSTITITNAFPNQDNLLIFTILGLKNPAFVNDFPVVVQSLNVSQGLIESSGPTAIKFQTQPGQLTTTIKNLGSDVVGSMTDISLEFTVQNGLDQTGYLVFSAPKWNAGTQSRTAIESMFSVKQADWSNSEQAYAIPCVSTNHPKLKCFVQVGSVATSADIANSRDTLKISGLANKINLGESIKIQTSGSRFKNPPSTAPIATFSAQSFRSDGSLIDSQSSGISYKVNTPYVLPSSAVTITTRYGEINVLDQFTFTIQLPLPMPVGAAIDITIPPTINIFSDAEQRNLILNSIIGNPPLYSVPDVTVLDADLQKIRINNLAPQARNYQDAGNPVVFTLLLMKNPGSTQETAPF